MITYTVNDEQFIQGYTRALKTGESLRFSVSGESHNLKIDSLTESTITINITSELQQATLSVGDMRRFELDGNNFYDLSVALNSINVTTNKAEITILSINEEITSETIAEEQDKEDSASESGDGIENEEPANFFNKWILSLVIILIIVGLVIYFKRKKK